MVKIIIDVADNVNITENIDKFKDKLLDTLSKNTKLTFEKNTPIHSGKGRNNYRIIKRENEHEVRNDTYYLPWVNDGTGIYGPRHTPIVPRRARVLHFHWKGKEWFLKSVKGQKGQKFVERSMTEVMQSVESAVVIAKQGTLE